MKLKHYFSAKRLRRKLSKPNITDSHCNINDSFTDFNDNETQPEPVTKDDMFLRPKRDGGIGVRSDMTQSFSGCLPSYEAQPLHTTMPSAMCQRIDNGSQTDLHYSDLQRSAQISRQIYSPISADPDLFFYKDSIDNLEVCRIDGEGETDNCFCSGSSASSQCDSCTSCSWHYHSLPSSQSGHHQIQDIQYNSLPSAMTQSVYADAHHTTAVNRPCNRWRRSRIKTNPWLPLPKTSNAETLRRTRKVSSRAEPRLSRFFSEVEELMREQLSPTPEDLTDGCRYFSQSSESLASTCSTATETPERQLEYEEEAYPAVRSPSEGYKSACGSSDLNLADTESFSAGSRGSSASNLSKTSSDLEPSRSVSGHHPPSLQDFNASLYTDSNWTSSNSLMSESMFASSYSMKYEALEDRVRKLCQSTSDLDEKMRLARIECSYIQTLS